METRKEKVKRYEEILESMAAMERNRSCWELGDEAAFERLVNKAWKLEQELEYFDNGEIENE